MNCRTVRTTTHNSNPWDRTVHPFTRERKQGTVDVMMSPSRGLCFLENLVSSAASCHIGPSLELANAARQGRDRESSGDHTAPPDLLCPETLASDTVGDRQIREPIKPNQVYIMHSARLCTNYPEIYTNNKRTTDRHSIYAPCTGSTGP